MVSDWCRGGTFLYVSYSTRGMRKASLSVGPGKEASAMREKSYLSMLTELQPFQKNLSCMRWPYFNAPLIRDERGNI